MPALVVAVLPYSIGSGASTGPLLYLYFSIKHGTVATVSGVVYKFVSLSVLTSSSVLIADVG